MKLRILPVHFVSDLWHVFPQADRQLLVTMEPADTARRVAALHAELQRQLRQDAEFLPPLVADTATTAATLAAAAADTGADALVINASAAFDARMLAIEVPVIAFAGERTPMMALYTLPPAVRRTLPNLHFALDAGEADAALRTIALQQALARLARSRMLVLGEYACFEKLPDPARLRETLGVELVGLPARDFLALAERADPARVAEVAARWRSGASVAEEPDAAEIESAARLFVALTGHMEAERIDAVSVGCLEVMYGHATKPFCFVLATLRDMGLPAGCESDATATLTLLILECIARRPGYMGNLVLADPERNLVAVSHGCSPRFMHGRDAEPLPYRLVHSHSVPPFTRTLEGGAGLTSYVDYGPVGQAVTLCRIDAGLGELFAARGTIVACEDTICDRTTLTLRVEDARAYAHRTTGNHQIVVYGDHTADLRAFCALAGMRYVDGSEALIAHG